MALAAVAVPALAVAGVLGWMLITTVQEVGSDLEEALSTQRRVAQIRVLMEKESGLVFRLPSELDQAKIGEHAGRLGDLAKMLDGEIEALAANRRVVTPETMKSIAGNRAQAKSTTGKIIEAAKSFAQTVAVELASGPFDSSMSRRTCCWTQSRPTWTASLSPRVKTSNRARFGPGGSRRSASWPC